MWHVGDGVAVVFYEGISFSNCLQNVDPVLAATLEAECLILQ